MQYLFGVLLTIFFINLSASTNGPPMIDQNSAFYNVSRPSNQSRRLQILEHKTVKDKRRRKSRSGSTSNSRNWMKQVDGEKRIKHLSIPGTHDTMAWQGLGATIWHLCQDRSLASQLNEGVRWLDIRLKIRGSRLGTYHGNAWLRTYLEDVMNAIQNFLNSNPSETVFMMYRYERGDFNSHSCGMFNNVVKSYKIYNIIDKENWYNTKLKDFRGKIVLVNEEGRSECLGGYTKKIIELDNYNGKCRHPLADNKKCADVVQCKWWWERRKRDVSSADSFNITEESDIELAEDQSQHDNITVADQGNTTAQSDESDETTNVSLEDVPNLVIKDNATKPHIGNRRKQTRLCSWKASDDYKNELSFFLEYVGRNDYLVNVEMFITYASAFDWKVHPKRLASHVNPYLRDFFARNTNGRTGAVLFDYPTTYTSDLLRLIYRRNRKCMILCEHGDCNGGQLALNEGNFPQLTQLGWNDKISRIRVEPRCTITSYEHENWQGRSKGQWNPNHSGLASWNIPSVDRWWNDRISSIKCFC